MMERPLEDRRALVTGASRGIGRATAIALARAGADVAIVARGREALGEVEREIEHTGRRAVAIVADVTDAGDVARLAVESRERLGPVEVLVNNAGRGESHPFVDHPDELWETMLALNLTSVYRVTKALVPDMITAKTGRIVNVASTAARTGGRYVAAYTAAKHGVLGLTRALATELVRHGITVNAVCPGYVDTPMTQATIDNIRAKTGRDAAEARRTLEAMSPQGRLIEPEEVAALVVHLALPVSRGINGQALVVDGGSVLA